MSRCIRAFGRGRFHESDQGFSLPNHPETFPCYALDRVRVAFERACKLAERVSFRAAPGEPFGLLFHFLAELAQVPNGVLTAPDGVVRGDGYDTAAQDPRYSSGVYRHRVFPG